MNYTDINRQENDDSLADHLGEYSNDDLMHLANGLEDDRNDALAFGHLSDAAGYNDDLKVVMQEIRYRATGKRLS